MNATAALAGKRLPAAILILWLACSALLLLLDWHRIGPMDFRDPDDAMRMVQVRDFLVGQSWFDVSQHRINPPAGGPMHWSRIVDLPIAALIMLFKPLVGLALAERIAAAALPLLILGALFAAFAGAVVRIAGRVTALVACILLTTSMTILVQFPPMRIDHHSWQILMAAITLWAAFDPRPLRAGVIAGLAVAFWLHVSSEALPYAVLFGALFGINYIRHRNAWLCLSGYLTILTAGSAVTLLVTRGWREALTGYCDAMSPTFLFPLIAAVVVLLAIRPLLGDTTLVRRFSIVATAGIAALGILAFTGQPCLAGPFGALDPLVQRYWYVQVMEGRPIWEQSPMIAAIIVGPVLVGIIGTGIALRYAKDTDERHRWAVMLFLICGALAVALLVMRAMSVAHLFALPGMALLVIRLYRRAAACRLAYQRIGGILALCAITPLPLTTAAIALAPPRDKAGERVAMRAHDCVLGQALDGLAALPPGIVLAPLDTSPALLLFTPHAVVGTAHHRNHRTMQFVIAGFMGSQTVAHRAVRLSRADYVAYCPGSSELVKYARLNPRALINDLEAGRVPEWLVPVPMPDGDTIRVYRVVR